VTEEQLMEKCGEFLDNYPLCEYFFLKTDELTIIDEVKQLSAMDSQIYGERRFVPPAPDSFAKCKERLLQYSDCFLFDAVYEVDDAYDMMRCVDARKEHAAMTVELAEEFKSRFGDVMVLGISCDLCEECPCPKKPCTKKDQCIYAMDTYGLQIKAIISLN
jgi:predicted metal-binding protein